MKTPMLKSTLCAFALCAALTPAMTFAQETGAAAYEAGDYAKAQELWTTEADAGSVAAMLGLARLADSGLLGEADPEAAFFWYLKAADKGDAEAQLNVALGYDSGLGVERDATKAMLWYGRAALRGVTDAQLGLASLFDSDDAANPALANHWYAQAGSTNKAETITDAPPLATPELLFSDVHDKGAELVWLAPAAKSTTYHFELLDAAASDEGYVKPVVAEQTDGSALLLEDLTLPDTIIWRVMNLGDTLADYRATEWQAVGDATPPSGRVTLTVDETVAAMANAAEVFAADLRAAGYWVRVVDAQDDAPAGIGTHVTYGYQSDLALADKVARYLPGPSDGVGFVQRPGTTEPGEIIVHLAAGE